MSVLVSKRKISSMQFYLNARSLRRDITKMLEQMFSDESKFCYSKGLEYYIQTRILDLLGDMMESIVNANEIFPTTVEEVTQRKLLQNKAIGHVANLENELEYLVDLFPEKIRQIIMFVDLIDHEKKLLRRWKQSNSKILKTIQGD
jgi:hypothetical protein